MRDADIIKTAQDWHADGQRVALATVVRTEGSAPRREGARMAVSDAGEMAGSVSGGCVENDVHEQAQEVLQTGQPRLVRYDITADMVWAVGLACGGSVEVWIERWEAGPVTDLLGQALDQGALIAQAILLEGHGRPGAKMLVWPSGETVASLGDQELDRQVVADALAMLPGPQAEARTYVDPAARVFLEVFTPPPHLVIFGGVHIAIPLTEIAKTLGYRVIVVDPRRQFAQRDRFPQADQILQKWPQQAVDQMQLEIGPATYCVILTHDPKIDEPALASLMGKGAAYVGAIGSRKTHRERFARMAEYGIRAEQLAEVYAPVGLDLGAETPAEIALAVMAEIVAVRRGAKAGFLRDKQ